MKKLLFPSILFSLIFLLSGCGPTRAYLQEPAFSKQDLKKIEVPKSESIAIAQGHIILKTEVSPLSDKIYVPRIKYTTKKLNCFIKEQLKEVALAKGFTVMGNYNSLDDMTFTEKKKTTAVLVPEITIYIKEHGRALLQKSRTHEAIFSGQGLLETKVDVKLIMIEPLSNEMIWKKNFTTLKDFTTIAVNYQSIQYYQAPSSETNVNSVFAKSIEELESLVYNEIAKRVVSESYRYLEHEEFIHLKPDIKNLKNIKRY